MENTKCLLFKFPRTYPSSKWPWLSQSHAFVLEFEQELVTLFCGNGKIWSSQALRAVAVEPVAICNCQCVVMVRTAKPDAMVVLWVVILAARHHSLFLHPSQWSCELSHNLSIHFHFSHQFMACHAKASWPTLHLPMQPVFHRAFHGITLLENMMGNAE